MGTVGEGDRTGFGVEAEESGESECCPEGAGPRQSWWTSGRFAVVFGVVVGLVLAAVSVVTSVVVYVWFGAWPWERAGLNHAVVVQVAHTVLAVVALLSVVAVVVLVYRKNWRDEREDVLACREVERRRAHEAAMRARWRAEDERAAVTAEAQRERQAREEARAEQQVFVNQYGAAAEQLASEDGTKQLAGLYAMAHLARAHRPVEPSTVGDREWTQQCVDMMCALVRQAGTSGVFDGAAAGNVGAGGGAAVGSGELASADAQTRLRPIADGEVWPSASAGTDGVTSLQPGLGPANTDDSGCGDADAAGPAAGGVGDGAAEVPSAVRDVQQAALTAVAGVLPSPEDDASDAVAAGTGGTVGGPQGSRGVYVVDVTGANLSGLALAGAAWRARGGAALLVARGGTWRGTDFQRVDVSGADFGGAVLDGAVLRGARLEGANLRGASLMGADAEGAVFEGASLVGAVLHRANLVEAGLVGADCRGAGLLGANLSRVDAGGADFTDARLVGANLRRARLAGANLRRAWLVDANLSGARLTGADCRGAGLVGANLRGAQLSGVLLQRAGLAGTDLRGVWLVGADVTDARLVFNVRQDPPVTIAEVAGPEPWRGLVKQQGCCGDDADDELCEEPHSGTWHAVAAHARQWAMRCKASERSAAALAAVVARRCDPGRGEPPAPDTPLVTVTAPLLDGVVASRGTFDAVPGWDDLVARGVVDVSKVIWVDETTPGEAPPGGVVGGGSSVDASSGGENAGAGSLRGIGAVGAASATPVEVVLDVTETGSVTVTETQTDDAEAPDGASTRTVADVDHVPDTMPFDVVAAQEDDADESGCSQASR